MCQRVFLKNLRLVTPSAVPEKRHPTFAVQIVARRDAAQACRMSGMSEQAPPHGRSPQRGVTENGRKRAATPSTDITNVPFQLRPRFARNAEQVRPRHAEEPL